MKRMSFAKTVDQMRNRTKIVTRRDPKTWRDLKPGDRLLAVEKTMGLKRGEKQVPIGVIEVVDVRVEPLRAPHSQTPWLESWREGFPEMSWAQFCNFYEENVKKEDHRPTLVRRIQFRHCDVRP